MARVQWCATSVVGTVVLGMLCVAAAAFVCIGFFGVADEAEAVESAGMMNVNFQAPAWVVTSDTLNAHAHHFDVVPVSLTRLVRWRIDILKVTNAGSGYAAGLVCIASEPTGAGIASVYAEVETLAASANDTLPAFEQWWNKKLLAEAYIPTNTMGWLDVPADTLYLRAAGAESMYVEYQFIGVGYE